MVKYVSTYKAYTIKRLVKDSFDDVYAFFSEYFYKRICCGYSFELYQQVNAIQMGTHNICLYKGDKMYTGCNLKTTELLDCELMGVYAVIMSIMVIQ